MGSRGGFAGWENTPTAAVWPEEVSTSECRQDPDNAVQERIKSGLTASTRQPSQLLESLKLLGAGGIAGAFSKSCTAPLARLTILYQVQALKAAPGAAGQLTLGRAFSHIIRQQGFFSLWKGNGVTVIHRLPYSAINFWAYERITEVWRRHAPSAERSNPAVDCTRRLVAGGLAGSIACAVAYPLDLVRTRLSVQVTEDYYRGIGSTLRTIVKDEGVVGLYRGLGATLGQVAPSLAVNYAAYESLRAFFMARNPQQQAPTTGQSLVCGSIAGLLSSTLTFPLDLVRRRMQLEGRRGAQVKYDSYAAVVRAVYRRQGLAGFYQGILPEYYKVVPGVAIAFCVYEALKRQSGVTVNKDGR